MKILLNHRKTLVKNIKLNMNKVILYILPLLALFIGCKNDSNLKIEEERKLIIQAGSGEKGLEDFKYYSDSTYTFYLKSIDFDYEKVEKFKGSCYLKNDTLYFTPFEFKPTKSEKAILKNNFIEFIGKYSSYRLEIKKNNTNIKSKLNFKKIKDFAVFTYYPESEKSNYKLYDLNQSELEKANKILEKCFEENKSKLRNSTEYVKQCVAVKNANNEIEVWISCYCKNSFNKNGYKFYQIEMNDGGNCNVLIKINITKETISELAIAGLA
jgi:hypothetical protein